MSLSNFFIRPQYGQRCPKEFGLALFHFLEYFALETILYIISSTLLLLRGIQSAQLLNSPYFQYRDGICHYEMC